VSPRRHTARRDALENREKILTVAADLMSRRGHHVPLADIAAAAGVGVGTLYRGYPDRAALLQALQLRAYGMLIAVLDGIEESGVTGADAIQAYLDEVLKRGDQLVLPLRGAPPLVDEAAVAARARIDAALERLLAGGRADGTIQADVNATDIIICAAMITPPLANWPSWSALARRHISVFIHGIRAPGAHSLPGPAVTRHDFEAVFRAEGPA
jgi:AcrR family transcriptional regulator